MRRMRPQWSSSSDNNVGNSSKKGVNVSPPMQTTSERICPRRLRALRIGRKRLENELLRYPKNASAYQSLGFILYEQGEYGECISALETATVLGQYSSRLLSTLGRALYNVGNNRIRAVQCLESAATISNDPTRRKGLDPDHWAYLAHAYAANLQPESSIHVLNKYLLPEVCRNRLKSLKQPRRGSEKVRFLKETGKLLSAIGQKEEIDPRKHTRTCFGGVGVLHLFCSSQLIRIGHIEKALIHYQRAHRETTGSIHPVTKDQIWLLIGIAYDKLGQFAMAQVSFMPGSQSLKTHTDFQSAFVHSRLAVDEASTWIVLGQTLLSIHDDFGAIDSFQQARIRDPNSREAMFHLIKLYSNCRMAKARDDLLKELDVSLEPMLDVAAMSDVLEASSDDETIQLLQKQLEIERTKIRMLHNEMQTLFLQTDSIQQGRVLVAESQPIGIINLDCDAEMSHTPETTNGDEPVVDVEQLNEALDHVCCQLQALEQQRHVIVDRIKSLKRQLQYEFASAKHYMLSQNRNTSKLPPSPLSLPGGMTIRLHRTRDEYCDIPPLITAQLIETLMNASDSVLSVTEASVLFRALNGDIVAAVAAVHENPFLVQTVKDSCSAAALHLCSLGNSIKKVEGSHLIEEAHRDLHQRWKQIKQKRLLGVEVNSDQHFEKDQRKSRVNRRKLFKKRQFENSHKRAGLCMITEKVCEEVNHELANCASQEFAKCGTEDEKLSQNEIVDNSRKLLQDEMVKGSARSNTTTSSIDTLQSNATAGKTPEVIRANVEQMVENEYNKHPIRKRRSNRSTTRRAQLPDENSFEQSATTNGIAGDNSGGDDTINTQEHFNEPELEVEDSPWDLSEKQSDEKMNKHVVKRTSSAAVQHSTDDAEGEVPVLARKRSFKNRKIRKTFHAAQLLLQSFSSEINVLDPKNNTNSNSDSSSSNASSDEESVKTDVSGDELFAEGTSPKSATSDYDNDEFDNESNISQSDNERNKFNSQNDNESNNSQNEFGSDQKDGKDADTAPENAAAISLNANLNSIELDVGSKADVGGVPVLNTRSNVTRAMASLTPPSDQDTISSSKKVFNSNLGLNSMTSQEQQQQHSTVKKGGMKTLGELGVSTRRKNSYLKKAKNRRTSRSGMLKRNNTMSVLEENSHDSIRHDHRKDSTNSAPDDIGKEITNLKDGLFSTELVHAENLSREESNTRQVVSSSASDLNASFDQHEVSIGMKQSSGTEMSIQTDKEGVQTQQEDGKVVEMQQQDGKVVEMQQEDGKVVEMQQEDGKVVEMQQEDGEVVEMQQQDGEEEHIDHYALLGQAPPMTLEQLNSHSSKQMVLESSRKLLDYDDDDDDLFLNIDDKIDMSWPDEFQIDDSDDL